MQENYIKEIILGDRNDRRLHGSRKTEKQIISVSYPKYQNQQGCITVICGKNNSGKSHILKNIIEAMNKKPYVHRADRLEYQGTDLVVVLSNPQATVPEKILHINDLTSAKRSYENFRLDNIQADPKGKGPKYKGALLEFLRSQFEEHVGIPNSEAWNSDGEYRLNYVRKIEENKLYLCNQNNLVIRQFQKAVKGALYFQRTKAIKSQPLQIWLYYDNHRIFNYGNWSDGQKTLFTCLLQLDYLKPDILLIDEIENHFHPEYISQLCSAIKETTRQTILVTHHPHVIFSSFIDQVIYIETTVNSDAEYEEYIEMQPSLNTRPPRRKIRELRTDFEKISSVYGLFDQQDHQLLQLACLMDDLIEREFVSILLNFLGSEADDKQAIAKQSSQVIESINLSPLPNIKILDFKSGKGRIFEEYMKKPCAKIEWHFWEPNEKLHRDLEELASRHKDVDSKILQSEYEIESEYYDYAILSNWLHSLTPLDFAKTLALIQKGLKPHSGKLIILELYPLIAPPKYAVSYDENTLTKLLNILGWKCESGQVQLPAEYISAYWIRAYDPEIRTVNNVEKNASKIRSIWQEEIMSRACARYNDMSTMSSVKNFFRYTSDFTSIMSIINEQRDFWKPEIRRDILIKSDDYLRLGKYIFKDKAIRNKLLREIRNDGIDENLFLKFTEVVTTLSQLKNEQHDISTSLILKVDDSTNSYFEKYKSNLQELEENFFYSDTKKLIEEVEQVDGKHRAYVILITGKQYKAFVQNIEVASNSDSIQDIDGFGDCRWNRVQSLIRDSGCALIIPGNSKIKIFVKGKLLVEYRGGEWKPRDFEDYRLQIKELAQLLYINESVVFSTFQKCIFASEIGRGIILAIQLEEGILKRCHNYKKLPDIEKKKIGDFSNEEYLNRVAGDGAVVLDRNGYTLAANATFQPQVSTDVEPISKGTRHLNAQKITKETQAIAFVVSADGPITVFYQGKVVFRVP